MPGKDFTLIKFSRSGNVTLKYKEDGHVGGEEDVKRKSDEAPLDSFRQSLQNLRPKALEIAELDEADRGGHPWADEVEMLSAKIKRDGDEVKAVFSFKRPVEACDSPLNVSTPLTVLDEEAVGLVEELEWEAESYLDGERKQGALFDEDEMEAVAEPA
jgi:hypothetical protein